jgi:hypothetical protein
VKRPSLASPKWLVGFVTALGAMTGLVGIGSELPAAADTVTFTSGDIGQSGSTQIFDQSGPWTLVWSYENCSGGTGNFIVSPNGSASETGPNELGVSGSGTDYYYDSGEFNLAVISECDWTITVSPSSTGPLNYPSFGSSQTGQSGQTQQFSVGSAWNLNWSYSNCTDGSGNFIVNINQPIGDTAFDVGPNELGSGGTGSDTYTDTGTFSLSIDSECGWSIAISPYEGPAGSPTPTPTPAVAAPTAVGIASTPDGGGYWIAYSNGAVSPHGDAGNYGGVSGLTLNAPINHIVSTPDGKGYWLVAADGGTFSEGDAQFYGSTGGLHLNAPVVDMAPTPDGGGYWLVASDGGIFSYGDAVFYGSTGSIHLNKPVVGMAADASTGGYWLVASDGGIFAFNAPFYGSTGSIHLNKPVNGMAATADGQGYWFVASDGGIFDYGNAPFEGSAGSLVLNRPIVGMAPDNATGGYWLLGSDGGIFSYDAPFDGAG